MNIAIDVREACNPKLTGKGWWTLNVVKELIKHTNHNFTLLTNAFETPFICTENTTIKVIPTKGMMYHNNVANWLKTQPIDHYISPTSYVSPWLVASKISTTIVVHDMIAFQSDPHQFKAKWIERLALPKVLKNVSSVVTVSKTTADDLQQLFPNINAPVTPIYAGGPQDVVASSCDGNYILCLSTLNPRKNQLGLIKAYNQLPKNLRDQYKLYLAGGRGWNDDEIVELAKTSNGVDWKGYVSIEEAEELWQHATCFALSSFYEGFGLPVLEAQLRGIPTLTSDRGALKEVASPGCVLVNPDSVDSITQGLIELLTNKPAPDKVFASQFSWQKTAEDLINAIA